MKKSIQERITAFVRLARACAHVLHDHPALLLLAGARIFFVAAAVMLGLLPIVVLFIGTDSGHGVFTSEHLHVFIQRLGIPDTGTEGHESYQVSLHGTTVPWLLPAYFLGMLCLVAGNTALNHQTLRAFAGQPVSLRDALRFTASRAGAIVRWTFLASTVGWLLESLERYFEWGGKLALRLIGVTWAVAAALAIPVLVREDVRAPTRILCRSSHIVREKWGEGLLGFSAVSALYFCTMLLALPVLAIGVGGYMLTDSVTPLVGGIALCLLVVGVLAWIGSTITHIFQCALYVYATEGEVPAPFTPEMLAAAWRVR